MKAIERGKKNVNDKGFQNRDNLILLATTNEKMKPITDPTVKDTATPLIPNTGTRAKYRMVRGILDARLIVKVCRYWPYEKTKVSIPVKIIMGKVENNKICSEDVPFS